MVRKLLVLANTLYSFGGGERYALELAQRLKRHADITVVFPVSGSSPRKITKEDMEKRFDVKGVRLVELPCVGIKADIPGVGRFLMMIPKPTGSSRFKELVKDSDVVYAISTNPFMLRSAIRLSRRYHKRFILGLHNPEIVKARGKPEGVMQAMVLKVQGVMEKRLLNSIEHIHVQTESQLGNLEKTTYKGKVYYMPHFLYFAPESKDLKVGNKDFEILFVARFSIHQKGLDLFKEIVEKALAKNSNLKFKIIGTGDKDGEQIVKGLVAKYPDNITWKGFVTEDELRAQYLDSALYVLPSRYETPGLTLLEAQSYGLPAVAFNVPGPKDIMRNKKQGVLAVPFDTSEFARGIMYYYQLFIRNKTAYRELKVAINGIIRKRYNEDMTIKKFAAMIND